MRIREKAVRIACAVVLSAAFVPVGAISAFAQDAEGESRSESDRAFAAQVEEQLAALIEGRSSDINIFDYAEGQDAGATLSATYPAKFDLRDTGHITPVKYQSPWGTCWSFASTAAAESSILNNLGTTYTAAQLDLSEHHLAWFTKSHVPAEGETGYDPTNSQAGEGMYWTSDVSTGERMEGGSYKYATASYASGVGPVSEEVAPYKGSAGTVTAYGWSAGVWGSKDFASVEEAEAAGYKPYYYSENDDWSVDETLRFSQKYELEESIILPSIKGEADTQGNITLNEDGIAAVKEQLTAGRAVQVSYAANDGFYNKTTCSYYAWKEATSNHAVTIVGWDDEYDVGSFTETTESGTVTHTAPDKGAWILKNSWGAETEEFPNYSTWGAKDEEGKATGYFYISYYDMSLDCVEAFDFIVGDEEEALHAAQTCYQYDYMPSNAYDEYSHTSEISAANVFTSASNETLTEVSCLTNRPATTVEYKVYVLDEDAAGPEDGTLASSGTKEFEYGGYHRFSLTDSVELEEGQSFSVVITQWYTSNGTRTYTVPVNLATNKYYADTYGTNSYSCGIVNAGESYAIGFTRVGVATDWKEQISSGLSKYPEYTFDNPSIKAFTVPAAAEPSLDVLAQLPSEVEWETAESTDVRFGFGIDSTDYESAGLLFSFSTTEDTAAEQMTIGATGVTAFTATQAFSKIYDGDDLVDASQVFGEDCNYAIAVKVTSIPKSMFDQTFYVRAYTIAEDGTVRYGTPRAVTISSLKNWTDPVC